MINFGATARLQPPNINSSGLYNPYANQMGGTGTDMVGNSLDYFLRNRQGGNPDISFLMGGQAPGNAGLARPYGPPATGGLEPNPNSPPATGGLQPNPNFPPGTGGLQPNPNFFPRQLNPVIPGTGKQPLTGGYSPSPVGISRPGFGGPQNGTTISRPLFQGAGGVSTTRPDIALQPPRRNPFATGW